MNLSVRGCDWGVVVNRERETEKYRESEGKCVNCAGEKIFGLVFAQAMTLDSLGLQACVYCVPYHKTRQRTNQARTSRPCHRLSFSAKETRKGYEDHY